MNARYNAVVDIFSLTASYPERAKALSHATQKTALAYVQKKASKQELQVLLKLAVDLGFLEEPIYDYYAKLLNKR